MELSFGAVRRKLTQEMEAVSSYILRGSCRTFDDYREQIGQLKGMQKALEALKLIETGEPTPYEEERGYDS